MFNIKSSMLYNYIAFNPLDPVISNGFLISYLIKRLHKVQHGQWW